ncbi:MAG: metallophosphoesterase family protein [Flavobacteriaceae bacterium]
MPFFYVAGNHDYTNEVMENEWFKRYGTDYYHFLYKNVLFICLNSEHGYTALKNPDLGDEQVKYVEKILKKNTNVEWTMVFMHQPLWLSESGKNWLKVENLLKGENTVFSQVIITIISCMKEIIMIILFLRQWEEVVN